MLKFNLRKLILICAGIRDVDPSIVKKELEKELGIPRSAFSLMLNIPLGSNKSISIDKKEIMESYFKEWIPEAELIINKPEPIASSSHFNPTKYATTTI